MHFLHAIQLNFVTAAAYNEDDDGGAGDDEYMQLNAS